MYFFFSFIVSVLTYCLSFCKQELRDDMPSILADVFCILGNYVFFLCYRLTLNKLYKLFVVISKIVAFYATTEMFLFLIVWCTDLETGALEEKNKRDHYTALVGACMVRNNHF